MASADFRQAYELVHSVITSETDSPIQMVNLLPPEPGAPSWVLTFERRDERGSRTIYLSDSELWNGQLLREKIREAVTKS